MPEPGELYNGTNTGNNIDSSSPVNSLTQSANKLAQSVDQLTKVLQGTKKDFDGLSKSRSKAEKDNTSDMSKMFEQANRDGEKRLSTAQKVGQSLIKSAQVVFNYTLNQFKRGFSSIVDNFNANFTTITSRMQKSNQEYASMLLESTKWIKDNDLRTQFSQIDWSNALVPVLESGIRGGLAEDMAYRNMISNRLLPMLSTNTREYTRMSKLFGKTFTDGIAAIGTYSERILQSAEGLEENNLNDIITTAYREVQEQVRREGGSAADVTSRMTEIIGSYQTAAKAYGAQTAMEMLQGYVSGISGAAEMSGSNLLGTITGARSFNQYLTNMERLVVGQMSGSDMKSAYAAQAYGPLGLSQASVLDILNNSYFGEGRADADKLMADFSASAETQENMYKLQEGYYQSITEQQDNFNENLMAELGTWGAQYLPHTTETLGAIWKILTSWFAIWSVGGGSGGVGGLLSNVLGKSNVVTGGNFRLFKSFANVGATSGKWGTSVLGNAAGGALQTLGPIAGLGIMGYDAVKGYKSGGIGGAISGAFLGNTEEVSAANILGNTAKGALIGAKFGPWGAVIGGAVGLLGNLTGSLINLCNAEKQRDKRIKETTKTLEENAKVVSTYEENLRSVKTAQEQLAVLEDEKLKGTSEYMQALQSLDETYKSKLGLIDEEKGLSEAQVELLKELVELEKEKNYQDYVSKRVETQLKSFGEMRTTSRAYEDYYSAIASGDQNQIIQAKSNYETMLLNDIRDIQEVMMKHAEDRNFGEGDLSLLALAFTDIAGAYNAATKDDKDVMKGRITGLLADVMESYGVSTFDALAGIVSNGESPRLGFAKGLFSVPYDEFNATLHKDEMVLPATEATTLRSLANATNLSDITEYLNRAGNVSTVSDTSSVSTLSTAIETQTTILSNLLSSILDKVVNIDAQIDGASRRDASRTNIPKSIIDWSGVTLPEW